MATKTTKAPVPDFLKGLVSPPATVKAPPKGIPSTVVAPLAVVWGIGFRLSMDAGRVVSRKAIVEMATDNGVNYYTARTQAARFRSWVLNPDRNRGDVPRSVTVPDTYPTTTEAPAKGPQNKAKARGRKGSK